MQKILGSYVTLQQPSLRRLNMTARSKMMPTLAWALVNARGQMTFMATPRRIMLVGFKSPADRIARVEIREVGRTAGNTRAKPRRNDQTA